MTAVTAVGVLGYGSIGRVVARVLAEGGVPSATLAGVARQGPDPIQVGERMEVTTLIERSDLIVEAAGQQALAANAEAILGAGRDLLVVSTGALADEALSRRLAAAGPGRLHVCSGAIGGLDMVRSVVAMGPVEEVIITSTKKPSSLIQSWMTADQAEKVRTTSEAIVVFDGDVRELVVKFPTSTNVAATLALAVGSWDLVRGRVRADPAAELTTHTIEVVGVAGRYRFDLSHHPSPENPRSSGVVPWSVVRALRHLCSPGWAIL